MMPEMPEKRVQRLATEYGIPRQQAQQLVEDGTDEEFEGYAKAAKDPQVAASAATYAFTEIRREGLDVDAIPPEEKRKVFILYGDGTFAKEAIPPMIRHMARNKVGATEASFALGLAPMTEGEIDRILDEIVAAHAAMVRERGEKALGPLMGVAMERLRGKVDGRVLNEKLRKRLALR
jgi:glutamyl-tRNA(Gln) amidotransferase subunit E